MAQHPLALYGVENSKIAQGYHFSAVKIAKDKTR
jgi:hypothetical protein